MKVSVAMTSCTDMNIAEKNISLIHSSLKTISHEIFFASTQKANEVLLNKNKATIIEDPGRGKSYILSILLSRLEGEVIILLDGNALLDKNAIPTILSFFDNPQIGCVSGNPSPLNSRKIKLGLWTHFLFDAAHRMRAKSFKENKFIECSGYLFAFRKKITRNVPMNVSDDSIIPYLAIKKGYDVAYAENARIYVPAPKNVRDFIEQRVIAAKGHELLHDYAPFFPKVKSFKNEVINGVLPLMRYAQTRKEFIWLLQLIAIRLYTWGRAKWETKIQKKFYRGQRLLGR